MSKLTKLEKSWIMYDWANSVYVAIMMAAIFPIYFTSKVQDLGLDGDMWWAFGTFTATMVMAVLAPFLGAIADFKGMKKKLFTIFLTIGIGFTLFNAITNNWKLMLAGYILSYIGFLGSNLFYDSFITDVTEKEEMDKVSSWGYAMGYIGGSTLPFILSIGIIMIVPGLSLDMTTGVKISIIIAVLWWGGFSIPLLKNVNQKYYTEMPPKNLIKNAIVNIKETIKDIIANKAILFFLMAYFFYIDGVNTVINMATAYGTTLGLDSIGLILALLATQIIAFPFALLYGRLAKRFGSINLIMVAVILYCFICILAFIMGYGVEEGYLTTGNALILFWVLAMMVGTSQGGIQALSRSFFGKLIPPEKSNEYFGFYDIFGKFAAILGPGLYALIKNLTGRSSLSILSIILLFAIGLIFIIFNKKAIGDSKQG